VRVYDVLGRQVGVVVDGIQPAGVHTVQWNGSNTAGQQVASGVYLYRLDARPVSGGTPYSSIRKMVVLK
jgi:flagellar hook assembly protein FlgD